MAQKSLFQTIYDAAEGFIDDLRNNRPLTVHELEIPDPPKAMADKDVIRLRKKKLGVSQAVFAQLMNTAPQTIHAWEQGRNRPSGVALRLLRIVERHPELLAELVTGKVKTTVRRIGHRRPRARLKSAQ